jgi:hypothetical protein
MTAHCKLIVIPIVDAAIGKTTNNTDFVCAFLIQHRFTYKNGQYDPYLKGAQLYATLFPPRIEITDIIFSDVFIKNPDGTEYIGQVWPGYTARLHPLSFSNFNCKASATGLPRLVRTPDSRLVDRGTEELECIGH